MSIGAQNENLLSTDFAARVVARVRRRRRRHLLSCALVIFGIAGAIGWMIFLALRIPSVQTADRSATGLSQPIAVRLNAENVGAYNAALSNFFPGAITVARFESSEPVYWHSYDPWWNLPSTDATWPSKADPPFPVY